LSDIAESPPQGVNEQEEGDEIGWLDVTRGGSHAAHNRSLVAARMQDSCRSILRAFVANPAAATEVLRTDRGDAAGPSLRPEAERVVQELNDLKDFMMAMLLTTPVEELERTQYLRELSDKERFNADVIAKLSVELKVAEDERDNDVSIWGHSGE